jgi:hypothetical protein
LAFAKGGDVLVVDGEPGPNYDQIACWDFSPDSKHVAYMVVDKVDPGSGPIPCDESDGGAVRRTTGTDLSKLKQFVVIDGVKGPVYDRLPVYFPFQEPVLSFDADGTLEYLARKGRTLLRVKHTFPAK